MNKLIQGHFLVLGLLVVAAALLLYKIDKPFWGYHDWNGVRYGQIARNYLRYGLVTTKLGQVENGGVTNPQNFQYLTHYPPLLPLLLSASFSIFGISEFAARIVPTLFSLGSVLFLYLLVSEFWNKRIALLSGFLFLATPMFIYFGKLPTHEPLTLFFTLAATFFFFRWIKSGENKDFIFLFFLLLLGEITGWAIYFILPLFTILTFVWGKKALGKILILWLSGILIFLLHLVHTYLLTGSVFGGGLADVFLFRTNLGGAARLFPFTIQEFVFRELSYSIQFFTLILVFLSFVWFLGFLVRVGRKIITLQDGIIISLLFFGLSYPLVFRNIAFVHDYILFYLLPFFAISGAEILVSISNHLPRVLIPAFLVLGVLVIFLERASFVQALWQSRADEPGYRLGKLIASETGPADKILVADVGFGNAHVRFVTFYADRDVTYQEKNKADLAKFDYLVEIKDGQFKLTKIR